MTAATPMAEVSEVLSAAADLIEQHGWGQGNATNFIGCHCADTAIYASVNDYTIRNTARLAFAKSIGLRGSLDVHHWNDAPGRTQAEVVAALRLAARDHGAPERDEVM